MWRKLFGKAKRLVEVIGSSGQTRVMTHDEYIATRISEARSQADFARYGLPMRREADHLEHAMIRERPYVPYM